MHKRASLPFLALILCGVLLTACAHETPVLDDTSRVKMSVASLTTAQTQQAQDLLAIKDLQDGQTTQGTNGAVYTITDEYFAASGAHCKKAKINRASVAMTGFDIAPTAERLHACYKGNLAFLPSEKL